MVALRLKITLKSQSNDHNFICLFLSRVDTTDQNLDTPIHASLLYHNSENTKLLCEYKANLELPNSKGRKPIHNANDTESLELLLDHGADIDARDGNGKIFIFNQIKKWGQSNFAFQHC